MYKGQGFGSKVRSVLAPAMVGGEARTELAADALTWAVQIPAEHLSAPA